MYFLIVLEAGKSKVKVLTYLVPTEGSLPDLQIAAFSLCPHMVERKGALSVSLLVRAPTLMD